MNHPFYTHRQYLIEQIEKLDLTQPNIILEFGTGIGSGDVFKEYADKYPLLTIISYEHDVEWFNQMKTQYESTNYIFNLIEWDNFDYNSLKNKHYNIIFVDQGIWIERARTVDEMIDNSDVIIIHDFDYFNKQDSGFIQGCSNIYGTGDDTYWGYNYNSIMNIVAYSELLPPTLIMTKKLQ